MKLFKKIYCLIGIIIFLSGLTLTPWIHKFATGAEEINNIRLIFMLFVFSTFELLFFINKLIIIVTKTIMYIGISKKNIAINDEIAINKNDYNVDSVFSGRRLGPRGELSAFSRGVDSSERR